MADRNKQVYENAGFPATHILPSLDDPKTDAEPSAASEDKFPAEEVKTDAEA